jgi:hypothetical protein
MPTARYHGEKVATVFFAILEGDKNQILDGKKHLSQRNHCRRKYKKQMKMIIEIQG